MPRRKRLGQSGEAAEFGEDHFGGDDAAAAMGETNEQHLHGLLGHLGGFSFFFFLAAAPAAFFLPSLSETAEAAKAAEAGLWKHAWGSQGNGWGSG